ncbi:MAG: hypothetical protein ABUJ98_12315 [Hyphomicrobium sp.]
MLATPRGFIGTAKAVLAGALPLPGTAAHRGTLAGSVQRAPQNPAIRALIDTHPVSTAASRGQEIPRPLPAKEAARWFVSEMQSRELTGERTWRALWDCYIWFCEEEELVPLPETMKARFAHELSKLCQRGQVRIREGGKLRRLTTYAVSDVEPAYLRTAA